MNQKGFIQIFILIIVITSIVVASIGTGAVLHKQGKLAPLVANISEVLKRTEKSITIKPETEIKSETEPVLERVKATEQKIEDNQEIVNQSELNQKEQPQRGQEFEKIRLEIKKIEQELKKIETVAGAIVIESNIEKAEQEPENGTQQEPQKQQEFQITKKQEEQQITSQAIDIKIISVNVYPDITSARIEWQTDKPTESKIFISGGGFSSEIFPSLSGLSTHHIANIDNLKGNQVYSFEIEAIAGINFTKQTGEFKTLTPPPPIFSISKEPVPGPSWKGWNYFKIHSENGTFVFEALTFEVADPELKVGSHTREEYIQYLTLAKSGWNYRRCDAINDAFLQWQNRNYPYPCPVSLNPVYLTMSNPTWQNVQIGLTIHPDIIFPPGTEIYYYKVIEQNTGTIFEYIK
jgi:hypothetical protein